MAALTVKLTVDLDPVANDALAVDDAFFEPQTLEVAVELANVSSAMATTSFIVDGGFNRVLLARQLKKYRTPTIKFSDFFG